jgi:hypothetical protein
LASTIQRDPFRTDSLISAKFSHTMTGPRCEKIPSGAEIVSVGGGVLTVPRMYVHRDRDKGLAITGYTVVTQLDDAEALQETFRDKVRTLTEQKKLAPWLLQILATTQQSIDYAPQFGMAINNFELTCEMDLFSEKNSTIIAALDRIGGVVGKQYEDKARIVEVIDCRTVSKMSDAERDALGVVFRVDP